MKGDLSQGYDNLNFLQKDYFLGEIGTAVFNLLFLRLIFWRSAPDNSGDETVPESQSIFPVDGLGLIGEFKAVQGADKPIAGTITREHSSGTIASMGCRG